MYKGALGKGDVVEAMHFTSVLNCGKRITCHVKPD